MRLWIMFQRDYKSNLNIRSLIQKLAPIVINLLNQNTCKNIIWIIISRNGNFKKLLLRMNIFFYKKYIIVKWTIRKSYRMRFITRLIPIILMCQIQWASLKSRRTLIYFRIIDFLGVIVLVHKRGSGNEKRAGRPWLRQSNKMKK
jgi:hypothetical protein